MGTLVYTALTSLDGFITDPDGDHNWAEPSAEVMTFLNDVSAGVQTELYGRRTYELMTVWETDASLAESGEAARVFAEWWQQAEKVVYSTTLEEVSTSRTRLERTFDPAAVRRLKDDSADDLSVFGPTLAAHAFAAGLVDEVHLFVHPRTVGGGLPVLPPTPLRLDLLDERRFADGTVYLRYAVLTREPS